MPSDEVVLLPNNDNIRPVAMQVCELATKTVRVVPTSGIVEGFAALLEYDPEAGAADNAAAMAESARRVVAGEVTQAVRDADGPGGAHPRRVTGWGCRATGSRWWASRWPRRPAGCSASCCATTTSSSPSSRATGPGPADTRRVTEWLAEHRPDVAVEVHHGGQPLYPYLISIE